MTNLKVASAVLRRCGYTTVETAENGEQALKAVISRGEAGCPFQAVYMDLDMPVMDGHEATRGIREWEAHQGPGWQRTYIVALTAHAVRCGSLGVPCLRWRRARLC